jgi:hypothetical protein
VDQRTDSCFTQGRLTDQLTTHNRAPSDFAVSNQEYRIALNDRFVELDVCKMPNTCLFVKSRLAFADLR